MKPTLIMNGSEHQARGLSARLLIVACWMGGMTGCSYLGLYRYKQAERPPPDAMAAVEFPAALEGGGELTGPMMAALKVAMDDYRPPWLRPENQKYPEDKCLADWKYIHTTVVQANENLFYVRFTPDLRQCGPGFVVHDAGADYAIDDQGRILAIQQ